jgi:hypothetical protein
VVLPDLLEVKSDCFFCIDHCISGNEVCLLSDTVNDYHDHVVAMHLKKFNNKVNADDIPSIFWSL